MPTRRLLPYLAVVLFPFFALAQAVDIRGVVADSTTGERIPFANVVLPGMTKGASSNLQGFYLIANAPQGRYQISASSIGYETRTKTIDVFGTQAVVVAVEKLAKEKLA